MAQINQAGFVHLHVHSAYSLLEGAITPEKLVQLAVADGQPALALTDNGNLFGALEFSEIAARQGLQPIIGCQINFDFQSDDNALTQAQQKSAQPMLLLASDRAGYQNLMALVSASYLESEQRAVMTLQQLKERQEGLIALSGGMMGPVGSMLYSRKKTSGLAGANSTIFGEKEARKRVTVLRDIFGDRFYLEIQRHGLKAESQNEPILLQIAYDLSVPIVATNGVYFAKQKDHEAHDALLCIREGSYISDPDRRRLNDQHYFKTRAQMSELFTDLPEAVGNSVEIARRCYYRPKSISPVLPRFIQDPGAICDTAKGLAEENSDPLVIEPQMLTDKGAEERSESQLDALETARLRKDAEAGLEERWEMANFTPAAERSVYLDRLNYELDIIGRMKYSGYFLIVANFINWAKSRSIAVGPGRGSGAASLVAFCLKITDVDPIRFSLLFERLLNPHRVSLPDFDIDFCQSRREEVIDYVCTRYGQDHVAQIITFGTLQPRAAIRDVGRVLQIAYPQVDRLCKMIPAVPGQAVHLAKVLEDEPRLRAARDSDENIARLLQIAVKLEGLYRHVSTHAAGVVIARRPLSELVPLYSEAGSAMPLVQFNMFWLEPAGLVKFDFLGLKTLTVIQSAVEMLEKRGIKIDVANLPPDDEETYSMTARGETIGVFQLESQGMRRAISGMRPDCFQDIVVLVALYRPGPMDNIPLYNDVKHGRKPPDYLHPLLEPILRETNGIIVYQEQVLGIAQCLCGYSLAEADLLRRAIGKKREEEMREQRTRFVSGAEENDVPAERAGFIFDLIEKFAGYGFNKAHAVAYGMISYQTAYLKAHYPAEFLAASMTLDAGNTDKLAEFVQEAKRLNITILPPSINHSGMEFAVEEGAIRYALSAIKGTGAQAISQILEARQDGSFQDIDDFVGRMKAGVINRRILEALIFAGAFDCIMPNRARLHQSAERILSTIARKGDNALHGQEELFLGMPSDRLNLPQINAWPAHLQLRHEFDVIGFYLSAHPLDEYQAVFKAENAVSWLEFVERVKQGASSGRLCGSVISITERKTQSGNLVGLVRLSDMSAQYDAITYPDELGEEWELLKPGALVILRVGAAFQDDNIRVRIRKISSLNTVHAATLNEATIFLGEGAGEVIGNLPGHLKQDGSVALKVVLINQEAFSEIEIQLPGSYDFSPQTAAALKSLPGVVDVQWAHS